MSQKLSLENLKLDIATRGHTFLQVSNPDHVMAGTLTVRCKNQHIFTSSVRSYRCCRENKLGEKNGCPECKRINAFPVLGSREKSFPQLSKRQVLKIKPKSMPKIFEGINSRDSLLMHLNQFSNSYNCFILQKIQEEENIFSGDDQPLAIEAHHIIPKSSGGPDESWNIVHLTKEDHFNAHSLRYDVYKHPGDKAALNFKLDPPLNTKEAVLKRIHLSHQSAKTNKSGFFSSEQQSKNGKKGGSKQTENKRKKYGEKISPITSEKLKKGLIWVHPDLAQQIIVPPNSIFLIVDLLPILRHALPTSSSYSEKLKNVSNASFTSAISKVFLKKRQSYLGFSLLD